SRLAFLMGSGCSYHAGLPLMPGLTKEVLGSTNISVGSKEILDRVHGSFDGAGAATIEDFMSELVDLLSIAERRRHRGANEDEVTLGDQKYAADALETALHEIKSVTAKCIREKAVDIQSHQQFVRAIHGS